MLSRFLFAFPCPCLCPFLGPCFHLCRVYALSVLLGPGLVRLLGLNCGFGVNRFPICLTYCLSLLVLPAASNFFGLRPSRPPFSMLVLSYCRFYALLENRVNPNVSVHLKVCFSDLRSLCFFTCSFARPAAFLFRLFSFRLVRGVGGAGAGTSLRLWRPFRTTWSSRPARGAPLVTFAR